MLPSHSAFIQVFGCALIATSEALVAQQFTLSGIPATAGNATDLVAADFSGDGALDFLITYANPPTGGFEVLSRLANGTWGTKGIWGGGQPSAVITAEVNGDGRPDVVMASSSPAGSGVGIFSFDSRMQPSGGSTLQSPPPGVRGLAWIRGDTDASPDLFCFSDSGVYFYRHLGGHAFAPPVVTPTPWLPSNTDVLVADFDGDGLADRAAIVKQPSQPSQLEVARGDGFGSFLSAVVMTLPSLPFPSSSLVTDLNRDGLPDLIVDTRVLLATGGGAFTLLPTALVGSARATGDFNGDGLPDILCQVGPTPSWVPQLQQPGMTFVGSGPGVGASLITKPFVLDVNQDGRLDILALYPAGSSPVYQLATGVLPHAAPNVWPYGIGTPGCRGHIPLSANADPTLGLASFAITATNTPINAPGILLAYSGPIYMSTWPQQLGGLGVTTHIDPLHAQLVPFSSYGHGQAHFPLPIPAMGFFIYHFQAVWLAPAGDGACSDSPLGFVSSNVLRVQPH
ncbi:MAG TPA: VCBS repeat-containing protein [Planctomycetota bacterium]